MQDESHILLAKMSQDLINTQDLLRQKNKEIERLKLKIVKLKSCLSDALKAADSWKNSYDNKVKKYEPEILVCSQNQN